MKTALITGGAVRLGRAIALALADAGHDVVIHHRSSAEAATALAAEIRARGRQAWTLRADLADADAVAGLVGEATALAGPLTLLVNNASIFPTGSLSGLDAASLAENLQVNALAPHALAEAFVAQADPDRDPNIIHLLDSRVIDFDTGHVAYHLSKRALLSLTRLGADGYAPAVRVNAVAPGPVLPPPDKDEAYLADRGAEVPLARAGCAADVADAVLYLTHATFVTGQILYIDGGRHLQGNRYA